MDVSPVKSTLTGRETSTSSSGVASGAGPVQAWREGNAKARERIVALREIFGQLSTLDNLQESERPARGLLDDEQVANAILSHLVDPLSGHGHDALCQWLYDTFQTGDPDLQAVVLRYVPALCGLYLPRIISRNDESLAGFEAVLLALYGAETKARQGCSLEINVPDLSQTSLYHTPRIPSTSSPLLHVGQLFAALEPQDTVKATKRACIVGVALDLFSRKIAAMPSQAKIDACQCAQRLARLSSSQEVSLNSLEYEDVILECGQREPMLDSNHKPIVDSSENISEIEILGPGELFLGNKSPSRNTTPHNQNAVPETSVSSKCSPLIKDMSLTDPGPSKTVNAFDLGSSLMQAGHGARIPLPWELIQPLLKILGHCLFAPSKNSEDVKKAASAAARMMYQRALHDVMPEAILATRSLLRLESASKQVMKTVSGSVTSTSISSKPRKPEILLASK
ncbi:hypothetical protein KP509_29G045000 [Ceratopteris richardii]|uniref:Hyccin n=1 Tax=Ceratopteris richardii TaxID=49495 RepID=A0A8T2R8Y7_CERRI|nr:hypothetical protein KP509_29G045000 [Ceratopteris richardii]